MKKLSAALALTAALTGAPQPRAMVGPAGGHGPLEAHVVMVLQRLPGASAFCSGAVIAPDIVLTAAHCVNGAANTVVFFRDSAGRPATRAIAATATHPDYRKNAIATRQRSIDLALVRLADPLPGAFAPAELASTEAIAVGDRFRAAGFGLGKEGAGATGGAFRWGVVAAREPLSRILLWAEDPEHRGLGACTGDSGGPVFAEESAKIVAVINWTTGVNKSVHCGALTQGALVAPQRGWIDSILRGWRAR